MIIRRQDFIDALVNSDISLVTGILDAGGDANMQLHGFDDIRPIHVAAGASVPEIVELLIERGADPGQIEDRSKHTPLHNAAQAGKTENIAVLLKYDVPLDFQGNSKLTPLHLAAANGHAEICKMLINKGARTDLKDIAELTALEYARKYKHTQTAEAILEAISLRNSRRVKKAARNNRKPAPAPGGII